MKCDVGVLNRLKSYQKYCRTTLREEWRQKEPPLFSSLHSSSSDGVFALSLSTTCSFSFQHTTTCTCYGPAQPPLTKPPFPSLQNPNLGCPQETLSPIAASDGCRLSYLSLWGGGWERRAPSIDLGTSRAPVSITRAGSSHTWLRSVLSHEDLQGESRAQGVLGEGSREVGGLPDSLLPQSSLLLPQGTSGLLVSVLAELCQTNALAVRKEESSMRQRTKWCILRAGTQVLHHPQRAGRE